MPANPSLDVVPTPPLFLIIPVKFILLACRAILPPPPAPPSLLSPPIELIEPENGSTNECPNVVNLCVNVSNSEGAVMNLTFSYWDIDNATLVGEFILLNLSNGTHCVHPSVEYNSSYSWNVTTNYGASTNISPTWYFGTVSDSDLCRIVGNGASYTWIIAIFIIFFTIPIALIKMRRKRRIRR